MTLRLKSYDFYIRLWHYLLPLIAFTIAAYVRLYVVDNARHPADYEPRFYFVVLLFTTLVWAIALEHHRMCSIDELFQEYTGLRKPIAAWLATLSALLSVLFF